MNDREYDPDLVNMFFRDYQDRGIMKWQGFYLSDQTAAVNKEEKKQSETIKKTHSKEMNVFEITEVINKSVKKNKIVKIELRGLKLDNTLLQDVTGHIEGYYMNKLLVDGQIVELDDIYSAQIIF